MTKYNAGHRSIKETSEYVNRKVNLLGVVVESSFPRKSRGTDYVSILKIVDDSQQCPELLVNIFTQKIDDLPRVRSHGDLIFLANVMIRKHEEGISAVFYKDSSSFALFDGNLNNDFHCYQATPGFHLKENENHLITHLRQWRGYFQLSSVLLLVWTTLFRVFDCDAECRLNLNFCIVGTMDNLLSLKDISVGENFDLICKLRLLIRDEAYMNSVMEYNPLLSLLVGLKVFHVYYEINQKVWMLFLWDGTDAPPLSLHGKLKGEIINPLPLRIEPYVLDQNSYRKFPSFGTVLRVTADASHEKFGQHFNYFDKWVKICYMSCQVSSGMWRGFLNPYSSVRLLSNNDNIIVDYERRNHERIVRTHGRLPRWVDLSSHFLTVIDGEEIEFSTLLDVLRNAEGDRKFCCVVRVVAILPFQGQSFWSSDASSEYDIKLTLEDSTARIHAFLDYEEWVRFFEACPVDERKVKMLLGVPEQQNLDSDEEFTRNPPWIKCCIRLKNFEYYVCCTRFATH
ncbi:hypothetical protein EZV62_006312 [Acer yangbiense]|uniref:Telomeric single stranded DNA binding POT1/Cdc13 domain-containing protein n=1 Tax=Acer yangbiense TaxID=1000413 RepID=A0A5C7IPQ8_9ROSI|nr:hypothetical protein EZV62_006312 [Acer yangbiense]